MIAGGYVLDLYCDVLACIEHVHVASTGPDATARAAFKIARGRGWVVNTRTGFVRCPTHKNYRTSS